MATLLDLAQRMNKLAERIPQAANELKKEVVRVAQRDLVEVTPVDTSEALSNWFVHNEEPWRLALPPWVEGFAGSTQRASADIALQQGERVLAQSKPGMPIFLSNNAGHIRELNDGSSEQEPAGFVERAEALARHSIKKIGLKL